MSINYYHLQTAQHENETNHTVIMGSFGASSSLIVECLHVMYTAIINCYLYLAVGKHSEDE